MKNAIRKLRDDRNLTQEELADLVGTSFQQISRLENGNRKLSQEWMHRIGRALGVPPATLMETPEMVGEFVDDPDELAWLRLYREMTPDERIMSLKLLSRGFGKPDDA